MKLINKLEGLMLGWAKNVPHLPVSSRKWLGVNVWWIVLAVSIVTAIGFIGTAGELLRSLALVDTTSNAYYVNENYTSILAMKAGISLVLTAASLLLLGFAVTPLKERQKKGWVLLFFALLVEALSVVIGAILTFSVTIFIAQILFGAIFIAIWAYFITEIHGEFTRPVKARIVKKVANKKS
jgi:hypothetical protein